MTHKAARLDKDKEVATFCRPCGKWAHPSRKAAKAKRARIRKSSLGRKGPDGALSIYLCPEGNGLHIGHLPVDVRNGTLDKNEYVMKVDAKRK